MCDDYKDETLFSIFVRSDKSIEQNEITKMGKGQGCEESLEHENTVFELDNLLKNENYFELNRLIAQLNRKTIIPFDFYNKMPVIETLLKIYQTIGNIETGYTKVHTNIQVNILQLFSERLIESYDLRKLIIESNIPIKIYSNFINCIYSYELLRFFANLLFFDYNDQIFNISIDLIQQHSQSDDKLLQETALFVFLNLSCQIRDLPKTTILSLATLAIRLFDNHFSDLILSILCNLGKFVDINHIKGYLRIVIKGLTNVSAETRIRALYLTRKAFLELNEKEGEALFSEIDRRVFTSSLLSSAKEEVVQCARLIQSVIPLQEAVGKSILESGTIESLLENLERTNFRLKESVVAMLCSLTGCSFYPELFSILKNHNFMELLSDVASNTSRIGIVKAALETIIIMIRNDMAEVNDMCSIMEVDFDDNDLNDLKNIIEALYTLN